MASQILHRRRTYIKTHQNDNNITATINCKVATESRFTIWKLWRVQSWMQVPWRNYRHRIMFSDNQKNSETKFLIDNFTYITNLTWLFTSLKKKTRRIAYNHVPLTYMIDLFKTWSLEWKFALWGKTVHLFWHYSRFSRHLITHWKTTDKQI